MMTFDIRGDGIELINQVLGGSHKAEPFLLTYHQTFFSPTHCHVLFTIYWLLFTNFFGIGA